MVNLRSGYANPSAAFFQIRVRQNTSSGVVLQIFWDELYEYEYEHE